MPAAARRSCSSTGCGCCPAVGTAGRRCSRRRATRRSPPAGPTIPTRSSEANAASARCSRNKTIGEVADHLQTLIGELASEARGHRPLVRRTADADPRRPRLSAAAVAIDPAPFRGVLPLPISALKSASARCSATRPTATAPSRSPTSSSATGSPTRSARRRPRQLYDDLRGARLRRAAVPGRDREPESVDRGQGRHRQPGSRPAADHLRREGPHRALGDRQRLLQAAEATTPASPRSSRSRTAAMR